MDGNFTKIIYSNEIISLNGIYLLFPIYIYNYNKLINKIYNYFHINHNDNLTVIKEIFAIENRILIYYRKYFNCNKQICYALSDQLRSGNIKIYCEKDSSQSVNQKNCVNNYVIKISGIWEDKHSIGITYKFIEYSNE